MKSPSFQFFVRDWILSRKVRDMTGDQVKGYMYLMAESWLEIPRATLPNDVDRLMKMAHMTEKQWELNGNSIMSCFVLGLDDRWYNERLLRTSQDQEKQRNNGLKGGRPTKNNPNHNPIANPNI